MKVTLRAATASDAEQVAEVLLSSRCAFLPYAPLTHRDEEVSSWIRDVLIPGGGVTVATEVTSVLGILATASETGVSWINQLYVRPGHVGRGIGSRLLEHALGSLSAPVRLYTFQANAGARRFYERHGFKSIACTDGSANEERCPDVLYELAVLSKRVA